MNRRNYGYLDFAGGFVFFGVGLGVLYWILQAFLDAYIFGNGDLVKHIFSPNSYEIWMRSMVIFMLVLSSSFVQSMISKRKRAEEALRNNEAMLRATIESSANGILVVDGRGKVVHSNARFMEMWRIPEELMRTGDDDKLLEFVLNQVKEPQAFLKKVRELYNSSEIDRDTILFKDNRVFDRYSQPLIRDNHIAGRVWSFADITERERASSRMKLTQFSIDHAADAIFWIGSDGQLIFVNQTACKVLGYTEDELLSMTVDDIDPSYSKEICADIWRNIKQNRSMTFSSHHKTKAGIVFPVEISANYLEFDGKEYNCAFARKIVEEKSIDNTFGAPESTSKIESL